MGQRHQIYIVEKKNGNYRALGAWHDQWCYGMRAVTNFSRLYELLNFNLKGPKKDSFETFRTSDNRYLDSAVKSVYGVDLDLNLSIIHNESGEDYLINSDGIITPENGDNNDGCSLFLIDKDKKELKACFFTPGHVEGQYWTDRDGCFKAWSTEKYLSFYYNKSELSDKAFLKVYDNHLNLIKNVDVMPISTQELKKLLKPIELAKNVINIK